MRKNQQNPKQECHQYKTKCQNYDDHDGFNKIESLRILYLLIWELLPLNNNWIVVTLSSWYLKGDYLLVPSPIIIKYSTITLTSDY